MTTHILFFGTIGGMIFTMLLFIIAFLGIGNAARDEEGHFRKKMNAKAYLAMCFGLSFFIGYPLYSTNYWMTFQTETPGLVEVWLFTFSLTMFINLWDLIVVDYLIVVLWHPSFLNLPDTDYYNKIMPHIKGFFKGIVWCAVFSTITTGIILLYFKF